MSGVGPVEPGEGTRASDTPGPDSASGGDPRLRPREALLSGLVSRYERHRRAALAATAAALLLAGGGYLYATRPHQLPPPAPEPAPPPPYPSQVVDVAYLEPAPAPRDAAPRSFGLTVLVSVSAGPPVTVTRISQPYAGLALTPEPLPPLRIAAGTARKIVITMRVTECGKVPESAGLPFLDVTLRNTRAIEVHSYILGSRYAHALSDGLHVACGNDFR
ncbi:Tat pathway signal sequence domain protein [Streptomyces naganishii]|uniref:Tat pathway signal sequence domain protein n=1 Tax=Streptomyces naganishii TaxID=285447 RepID=UPI00167EEB5B|nr:Tat pathway signal sequence domain protein [Streptomyces naganishii]